MCNAKWRINELEPFEKNNLLAFAKTECVSHTDPVIAFLNKVYYMCLSEVGTSGQYLFLIFASVTPFISFLILQCNQTFFVIVCCCLEIMKVWVSCLILFCVQSSLVISPSPAAFFCGRTDSLHND